MYRSTGQRSLPWDSGTPSPRTRYAASRAGLDRLRQCFFAMGADNASTVSGSQMGGAYPREAWHTSWAPTAARQPVAVTKRSAKRLSFSTQRVTTRGPSRLHAYLARSHHLRLAAAHNLLTRWSQQRRVLLRACACTIPGRGGQRKLWERTQPSTILSRPPARKSVTCCPNTAQR